MYSVFKGNSIVPLLITLGICLVIVVAGYFVIRATDVLKQENTNAPVNASVNLSANTSLTNDIFTADEELPGTTFHNQIFTLESLWEQLEAYHFASGIYPATLDQLAVGMKELQAYCEGDERDPLELQSFRNPESIHCGKILWGDLFLIPNNNPIDAFTQRPFPYHLSDDQQDYQLTYTMQPYEEMSDENVRNFSIGKNVATKDMASLERQTTWKTLDESVYQSFLSDLKTGPGEVTNTDLQVKVYPQDLGNGQTWSYVTLTWTSDIETEPVIAYGNERQDVHQDNFKGEGRKLRTDHRIDFNLKGSEPIHYVLRSCMRDDSGLDFRVICSRTLDKVITIPSPVRGDGPETISNGPVVFNVQFSPASGGTLATWETYPSSLARIGCSKKESPNEGGIGNNYGDAIQDEFSFLLPTVKGTTYSCKVDAYVGTGTVTFPIVFTAE